MNIIQPLAFYQILILLVVLLGGIGSLIIFLVKRGGFQVKRKDTTFLFGNDGEKIEINKEQAYNLIVFIDALNTKDDISRIDRLVFERQKKLCKEQISNLKNFFLQSFKKLLSEELNTAEEEDLVSHRDYLYFTLLNEKVYGSVLQAILDDFEENGLSNKRDGDKYSYDRASAVKSIIDVVFNSLYAGIGKVPKRVFDIVMKDSDDKVTSVLVQVYKMAVRISKRGAEKKEEYKQHLFEKVKEIEGINEHQFMKMFDSIKSEDFLDI